MNAVKAAAAGRRLGRTPGPAEHIEALARQQYDPDKREGLLADAAKARQSTGTANAHLAAQLVKAAGARSLEEAWRKEDDPKVQAILFDLQHGIDGKPCSR